MNLWQDLWCTSKSSRLSEFNHIGVLVIDLLGKLMLHPNVHVDYRRYYVQEKNYSKDSVSKCNAITPSTKKIKPINDAKIIMSPNKTNHQSRIANLLSESVSEPESESTNDATSPSKN